MSDWHKYDLAIGRAPQSPGVYVIIVNKSAVYVGSAHNLYKRINAHANDCNTETVLRKNMPWHRHCFHFGAFESSEHYTVKYRTDSKYGEGLMREARLIRKLRPCGNILGKWYSSHFNTRCKYEAV